MNNISYFENNKQLFDYARNIDLNSVPSLEEIFSSYEFNYIEINELEKSIFDKNTLLIDARSEKEFTESAIPNAINFPILNNYERHNVGLIYKKYSKKASEILAINYAEQKATQLKKMLLLNHSIPKNIIIFCWRGGGRSKYLAKMISDYGYKVSVLIKGFKCYRNNAVKLFNLKIFPIDFIEIRGLTGCGKTEILNKLKRELPVIDLEDAARHFSSLFGQIPYTLKEISPVASQAAFENNIYAQIIENKSLFPDKLIYLIESESKKVGNFRIPDNIYNKIESSPCINIQSSLAFRIKRIEKDYFANKDKGIKEMLDVLRLKERFFRKEMSNKYYENAVSALMKRDTSEFCEIMLVKYYDTKYRVKEKVPIANICSDNTDEASEEIKEIIKKLI